jgi:hypothetical protein
MISKIRGKRRSVLVCSASQCVQGEEEAEVGGFSLASLAYSELTRSSKYDQGLYLQAVSG